jgi:hypothetical protein
MLIKVDKFEASSRQLDCAIRLFFNDEDLLSILTLVSASSRILRDIAESTGKSEFHNFVSSMIIPDRKNEFWKKFNEPFNFLKHADTDPIGVMEYDSEIVGAFITMTILYAETLGQPRTKYTKAFSGWYFIFNPHLVVDDAPFKQLISGDAFKANLPSDRIGRLKFGQTLCSLP